MSAQWTLPVMTTSGSNQGPSPPTHRKTGPVPSKNESLTKYLWLQTAVTCASKWSSSCDVNQRVTFEGFEECGGGCRCKCRRILEACVRKGCCGTAVAKAIKQNNSACLRDMRVLIVVPRTETRFKKAQGVRGGGGKRRQRLQLTCWGSGESGTYGDLPWYADEFELKFCIPFTQDHAFRQETS